MDSLAITQLALLISNYIASKYDVDTMALIAAILVQIGDTLVTIAAVDNLKNQQITPNT
ncbi:MAG: DUF6774 domain-containing protein [Clostridia bacterium]|nr:DUF6774 domain-containing protein [Clostridia bacterium]